MVEELCSYTPQDLADLDALMHELSAIKAGLSLKDMIGEFGESIEN